MRPRKRRREGKTDYKARIALLRSGKARVVFRKTNRYVIGQYVKSTEGRDKVIIGLNSKELLKYGWPENLKGSLKSLSACYLTGFLLGKKILDKEEKVEAIFDIGLLRGIKKSREYAFLKGVIDAEVKIGGKKEIFPDEERLKGEHLKKNLREIFNKIKENIEKKFI